MKVALVNPAWTFEGSIYFGCRAAHLPLELGYSKAMLERNGHEVVLLDGLLEDSSNKALAERVAAFAPELTMVVTAPTYLFWRCPPPELRVPSDFLRHLAGRGGCTVIAGPHLDHAGTGSCQDQCRCRDHGECEEVITALADSGGSPVAHGQAQSRRHSHLPGRTACQPLHGPFGARLARSLDAPSRPPSSSLRAAAGGCRCRGGSIARLSLFVHILRQACLSGQLSAARSRAASGRDRPVDRAGYALCLFHRRDLPAAADAARGACRAQYRVRRADPDRFMEAGAARAARPGRLRVDRGRCRA